MHYDSGDAVLFLDFLAGDLSFRGKGISTTGSEGALQWVAVDLRGGRGQQRNKVENNNTVLRGSGGFGLGGS